MVKVSCTVYSKVNGEEYVNTFSGKYTSLSYAIIIVGKFVKGVEREGKKVVQVNMEITV